jgi:hypothetical protein
MLFLCSSSQAQTSIDVSKITCEQYNLFKVADPQKIAIWLSGYYHGTRNDMVLETQRLQDDAEEVGKFCDLNPKTRVLEAVKNVVGASRKTGG